jgi:hypothetical protein
MAPYDRVNISPGFASPKVPCEGTVGDLIVLTPLKEKANDTTPQGSATLWFCTKSAGPDASKQPAIWARVQFDGIATCATPFQPPPQNKPNLNTK